MTYEYLISSFLFIQLILPFVAEKKEKHTKQEAFYSMLYLSLYSCIDPPSLITKYTNKMLLNLKKRLCVCI